MRTLFATCLLAVALVTTGCDVDVNEAGPSPGNPGGVNVDVDTPAENRMERREERRENLRDAVDGVDVKVGDGGVQVDVDGE